MSRFFTIITMVYVFMFVLVNPVQAGESGKVCGACFEYKDGWYSYIVKQNGKILYESPLFGESAKCEQNREHNKDCRVSANPLPQVVCNDCFEYYDGWYSFIVTQGGKVIYNSALFGEFSECRASRERNKFCRF